MHAHPAPFSYLDLRLQPGAIEAALVAHVLDFAHDLRIEPAEGLLDPQVAAQHRDAIFALVTGRLRIAAGDRPLSLAPGRIEVLADRQALRLEMSAPVAASPGRITVTAGLFPYDPNHQTFLNIYERGSLSHQAIFDREHRSYEYFAETVQGRAAVMARFIAAGIHHIVIGPDHILFLVGLLLLGGTPWQLAKIVTAFTVAHSLTLTLAVLGIVAPPARVIEPTIALSIIYVGADNLLMKPNARDVRAWVALVFGLIHGFGFASVLQSLDLPRWALGWSLLSFNVGVEIGQLALVLVVASALAAVRSRNAAVGRRLATVGSVVVVVAGTYWFVERVFG